MARKTAGLRLEIILHLSLLMMAALLFTGFLLVKLTERELLRERTARALDVLEMVAGHPAFRGGNDSGRMDALELFQPSEALGLRALAHIDRNHGISFYKGSSESLPDSAALRRLHYLPEPLTKIRFSPPFPFSTSSGDNVLQVTVPISGGGRISGALQARFSLEDLTKRLGTGYRLIFLYAVLYGIVLVAFGAWLLNRNLVRPLRKLLVGTREIAAGNLDRPLSAEGPREIVELTSSFNAMMDSLRESRCQTDDHIRTLRETNLTLEKTRDELVRSEKMASVGHLAAGMAHEIGNPLGAAMGYLDLLRARLPQGEDREIADRSMGELERIDQLVRDLLDYAAPSSRGVENLDPASVVTEAMELLRQQGVLDGIEVERDLPSLPPVSAERHKMVQVIVNLLLNARDATPSGGRIRVSGKENREKILVSVADEGKGMPPEVLRHIFEPFFTTKDPGKGRGLGLAVCRRIVEEIGGRLTAESSPGNGSVFLLELPKSGSPS